MRVLLVCTVLVFCCLAISCGLGGHYIVSTPGMSPALETGDHFTTIEIKSETLNPLERFDIVVYKPQPVNGFEVDLNSKFTARLIGLGGEKIEIKKGRVFINDKPLDEPFEKFEDDFDFPPVVIPNDRLFLLGDNRPNSLDSRYWINSTISVGDVYGKVNTIIRKEDWDKGKRW